MVLIIGFTLVCIGLGYALYRMFFSRPKTPEELTPEEKIRLEQSFPDIGPGGARLPVDTGTGALPEAGRVQPVITGGETARVSRFSEITDSPVIGAKTTESGLKFYNSLDGKFYRQNTNGEIEAISDQTFYNVNKVVWSPTKNQGIIEYPDGANIYYDFDDKKQITLPTHWQDFSFSPEGDQIAAKSIGASTDNTWLVTANPDGSEIKLIEPMGKNAKKVTVDWSPNRQVVALSNTGAPMGDDQQEIFLVGMNGENFRSLIVDGQGFKSRWSEKGEKLLYSVYSARSEYKPELWISGGTPETIGVGKKSLNLNTWADKCAFLDERFVYCAVPDSLPKGSGMVAVAANNTNDRLYKVDTVTGLKTEIEMEQTRTIDTIFFSNDGKTLLFTDKNIPGLFSVKI